MKVKIKHEHSHVGLIPGSKLNVENVGGYIPFFSISTAFEDTGQNVLTTVSLATAFLGIAFNLIVIKFFINVIGTKRIQSCLWANVAFSFLFKCFIMIYSAMGDFNDSLSNTVIECRLRYALPTSADLICISNYIVLLLERTSSIHCPALYSLLPDLSSVMLFFGWVYGASYFLFIFLRLQDYDNPIQCHTPFINITPLDPTQLVSFITVTVLITIGLTSMLFLYPANFSEVEKIRIQIEINATYLAIVFGTALVVLWIPKQMIAALYWSETINLVEYTIAMKMAYMVMDLTVLLPFVIMVSTSDFQSFFRCLVTMESTRIIKERLIAQESYKNTIRKLVEEERVALTCRRGYRTCSLSHLSTSTGSPAPIEVRNSQQVLEPRGTLSGTFRDDDFSNSTTGV